MSAEDIIALNVLARALLEQILYTYLALSQFIVGRDQFLHQTTKNDGENHNLYLLVVLIGTLLSSFSIQITYGPTVLRI